MPYAAEPAGSVATPPFDLETATAFLNDQAETMAAGLRNADDPLAIRAVLRSHDGGHDDWLGLIAAVTPLDAAAGDVLATLYALHGRVAGSLERAGDTPADAARRHVRRALSQRLKASTADAVAVLEAVDRSIRDRP